jgi:hypothetical protein
MSLRPSPSTTIEKIPPFLERIHANVHGPVDPPNGPFRFYFVLIDALSKWSQVSLLSTRNLALRRLLAHILELKAHFPEHPIKTLRVDKAEEFTSQTFDDFCIDSRINVEYPIAYVHFQNGIAESIIKQLQVIVRPMLMQSNLPPSAWSHAILHAAGLIQYCPFAFNAISPHTLALGMTLNISHLRTFGCQVLVPIMGSKPSKHSPQRRKGIYIGFDSNSIIRCLEKTTADVYKAIFLDCHFSEDVFPTLNTGKPADNPKDAKLTWQLDLPFWNNPRIAKLKQRFNKCFTLPESWSS